MKLPQRSWRILASAAVLLVLAACDRRPFEKAGKAVDRVGQKVGDKIKEITK